ncbi:hypothetical protein [Aeromonas bivalvium]|uniref:Uncharacterized protein n=1 Tax=Aeromonas bivalvium TaxID=440079 RepID=A0ABW9GMV5_9GAMM|nr:hypothetical protein [Aeromonas bivalvium]
MNHLLLLILLGFALFYWVYFCRGRKGRPVDWQSLPTREQYLALHPEARGEDGIACHHCGHLGLQAQGRVHLADFRHQYACPRCHRVLFRSQ